MGRVVFHIALESDWDEAQRAGEYRISTLGRSLDDVGFIHCSASPDQVLAVAAAFYADVREPLVLLAVDVEHVGSEVRDERVGDAPEPFPHVYGPIPVSAVSMVVDLARDADDVFDWPHAGG